MNEAKSKPGILFGTDGKIRLLWRAVIFYVLAVWLLPYIFDPASRFLAGKLHISDGWIVVADTFYTITGRFGIALICTAIFARYERRRVDSYGLPMKQALNSPMWEGVLVGTIMAGSVVAGMYLLGAMQIRGLETTGSALVASALTWLYANIWIGVSEEFVWRSYLLQTLRKSIGFWPGATAAAVLCTVDHYFGKSVQNMGDALTIMSLILVLSYSVVRTGTLWFAVGFHIAFDYVELFVLGTNGGQTLQGRLLDATFNGPSWLTGGMRGLHASFLMYPAILLAWLYIWWRYKPQRNAANAQEVGP